MNEWNGCRARSFQGGGEARLVNAALFLKLQANQNRAEQK